jgi:hypothetical protein
MSEPTEPTASTASTHWLVRPQTIRRLWVGYGSVLVLTVLPDLFLHRHAEFGLDGGFGFYAWYGFLTCIGMILFAKVLGMGLKRPETHYDAD